MRVLLIFWFIRLLGAGNDVTTLDALGSNFCLVGNMETMHIDIVVSEHGKMEKKKGKSKGKRLFVEVNASKFELQETVFSLIENLR